MGNARKNRKHRGIAAAAGAAPSFTGAALSFAGAVLSFVVFLGMAAPRQAAAQCETPGATMAFVNGTIVPSQEGVITALFQPPLGALPAVYTMATQLHQEIINSLIEVSESLILARMSAFWDAWFESWKNMTAQLNASLADQTRQYTSLFDSSNLNETSRTIQHAEREAKEEYEPDNQSCIFDTRARYMTFASETSKAVAAGMSEDAVTRASNRPGTPGAMGARGETAAMWETYTDTFCDPAADGGHAPCDTAGPMVNAHVMPSKTVFGGDTIEMSDPDVKLAVDSLGENLMGGLPPTPKPPEFLNTPQGRLERERERQYQARLNAVQSLYYAIIGERVPGAQAPEIQQLRLQAGATSASLTPSEREIRQSVLDELWTPWYYVFLMENPAAVQRKEVYLQAYNLQQLNKLVDKMEKIVTVHTVQTADMLGGEVDRGSGTGSLR